MIEFITGELCRVSESSVVIETGGIGYLIHISSQTASSIGSVGDKVKIYTCMSVREDGISLYGFQTQEELSIFQLLITVSGVGYKSALQILSSLSPFDIVTSVVTEDVTMLSKAQGVGKKTAQRLILELKDKFKSYDALQGVSNVNQLEIATKASNDSIDALIALGYPQAEAIKAVSDVAEEGLKTEQIIKLALKKLAKG